MRSRVELPEVVLGPDGRPVADATVQVRLRSDGSDATIYQDDAGAAVYANPVVSDAQGRVTGWVDRGAYDLTVDAAGLDPWIDPWDAAPAGDGTIDADWIGDAQVEARHLAADAIPPRGWVAGDEKDSLQGGDHDGWLLADGRNTLVRADFPVEFVDLMIARGFVGVNGATFGIPDRRGRVRVGKGLHADVDNFTDTEGAAAADRRPKHKHAGVTDGEPNHSHTGQTGDTDLHHLYNGEGAGLFFQATDPGFGVWIATGGTHHHGIGADGAHDHAVNVGPQTAGTPTDGPAFGVTNPFIFTGLMPDGSVPPATASSSPPRVDSHIVTAALAVNAEQAGAVALPRTTRFLRIAADRAARIRVYSTAADRDADAARAIGVVPADDAGVIAEVVLTGAGGIRLQPQPVGSNFDVPVADQLYYRVQNRSGGASAVDVTLTTQKQE